MKLCKDTNMDVNCAMSETVFECRQFEVEFV